MALTTRERKIMILTGASVLLLVVNHYVFSPVLQKRSETRQARETLGVQVEQASATLNKQKSLRPRWEQMQENGLGTDVQKAEAMVYRYIETSSSKAGFEVGSVQPERLSTERSLGQIDFLLSGSGSMASVTRFLWNLETAPIPLRIKSCQLGSKNEMAEEMTLQLKLSTVYVKEQTKEKKES